MPHNKSTAKRVKQSIKQTASNRSARSAFRTSLKKAEQAVVKGDAKAAGIQLQATLKSIGLTAKKGLIHPNKAARHASRLTRKVNALSAKTEVPKTEEETAAT